MIWAKGVACPKGPGAGTSLSSLRILGWELRE